jgi:hypothetical protein
LILKGEQWMEEKADTRANLAKSIQQ